MRLWGAEHGMWLTATLPCHPPASQVHLAFAFGGLSQKSGIAQKPGVMGLAVSLFGREAENLCLPVAWTPRVT